MKKVLCFAAAAMAIFASCQKTEVVYSNDGPQEIALFAVNKVPTKAPVSGESFWTFDNMRVSAYLASAVGNEANVGEYFNDILFTYSGADNKWTGGQYWPLFQSKLNFLAVTESGGGVDNTSVSFGSTGYAEVTLTGNDVYGQNDVMYACGQGSTTGGNSSYTTVDMKFHHALAWVNFAFKTNKSNVITIDKVELTAKYNGTMSLAFNEYQSTGTLTGQALSANWMPEYHDQNKVLAVPNTSYSDAMSAVTLTNESAFSTYGGGLLVVPGDYTGRQFVITYTVKSGDSYNNEVYKQFTYTYPISHTDTWKMGKKYTYNVNITLTGIEIIPSVNDWISAGAITVPLG